ncbi:hypothetical protein SY88_09255 [Clostridiales bacterium PH28_bin88]|nr:hypothetical protein SY88_09255 [Clostridiales bacterium PH28_bin88]
MEGIFFWGLRRNTLSGKRNKIGVNPCGAIRLAGEAYSKENLACGKPLAQAEALVALMPQKVILSDGEKRRGLSNA